MASKGFLLALLGTVLYLAHTLGTTLAFFLAGEGLGPEAVGSPLLLSPLQLLLLGAWAGRRADREGYGVVVAWGARLLLAGGVGLAALAYFFPLPGALLGLLFLGVGRALFQAANNAQVFSLAPKGEEALTSGALSVARVLGVRVVRVKLLSLLLGSLVAGLAGGVYAMKALFINPYEAFSLGRAVEALVIPIFGGLYTTLGPLLGGVVLVGLEQVLRLWIQEGYLVVYGAILILAILFLPRGLLGLWRRRRG